MVNYSLEEFKAWLEGEESRKAGLNWSNLDLLQIQTKWKTLVEDIQRKNTSSTAYALKHEYIKIIKQWIDEVDQRKRERIPERSSTSMINAQKAFQRRFTFADALKTEIANLKAQLAEYESQIQQKDQIIAQLTQQKSELERLGQANLVSVQSANDKINELKTSNQNLTQELTHLKQKHTNYLNQRKAQLTQEIQLIKEALND